MFLCRADLSLVLLKLVIFIKIFALNCDVSNSTPPSPTVRVAAVLKIFDDNGQELISATEIYDSFANSTRANVVEKISGKLIYAKIYDQALLDKILNKSDTYKKCHCVRPANKSDDDVSIALMSRNHECSIDDHISCALDASSSVLLLNDCASSITWNRNLFG